MEKRDFFVSYNKEDKAWAKWVAGLLEEKGFSVYIQAWDIYPGDDFIERMNDFLEYSENYIPIWSKSFSESMYCKKEFHTAFNKMLQGGVKLFLPVVIDDTPLGSLYKTTVYVDLFGLDETNAQRKVLGAIGYTQNPRKKGAFPSNTKEEYREERENYQQGFPGTSILAESTKTISPYSIKMRNILIAENNSNKKGELFNQLIQDVFHALGFSKPRINVQKTGREIDIVLHHRTEKRVALVESKAHSEKIGGSDINKFVGVLDVERRAFDRDGNNVVGYFVSQSGFTEPAIEQERERALSRKNNETDNEIILMGPEDISRELIQGKVLCTAEQATLAIQLPETKGFTTCNYADLLACEYGWIWVLYFAERASSVATHFTFVHADGKPLLSKIAASILRRCSQMFTAFAELIYIDTNGENSEEKLAVRNAYYKYLAAELGEIQFEGIPTDKKAGAIKVNLEKIFVPLIFNSETSKEAETKRKPVRASIHDVLKNSSKAAILARPGGGKSTLIRRIALAYAYPERKDKVEDNLPDADWFPVYIRCRDLGNDATKSILEIISSVAYRAEMQQHEKTFKALVEDALQSGKVLLLIDGLDEIVVEQHRIVFVNQLRTFASVYPAIHLIVTSRATGFRSVGGVMAGYCDQYTIADLNNEQISKLTLKWHEAILDNSKQAIEDAKKVERTILGDPRIVTLARNPLLLTTLLFVKRWLGYLPNKRCQLYEEMIKLLLVTWNAVAHDRLDLDETEPQLAYVAYQMVKSGTQKITAQKLKEYIVAARKSLPDILGYTQIAPSKFIDQVEERSSLLIQQGMEEDERGQLVPSYEFSHLSFQEYLAAKAVIENWVSDIEIGEKGFLSLIEKHYEETQWVEVISLAAVLSGRQVKKAIEFLLIKGREESKEKSGQDNLLEERFAVLHLANFIANEVPMSQENLDQAIKIVIRNKRNLFFINRLNAQTKENIFNTILNSKYAMRYKEIVHEELFGEYDDKYVINYLDAWNDICGGNGKRPILHEILNLLNSNEYCDNIRGAYSMMQYAFQLRRSGTTSSQVKYKNRTIYSKIFDSIKKMLQSDDSLSVLCAAWCIAWSGYNYENIISEADAQEIVDVLVALWVSSEGKNNLGRMIAWAISSISKQRLQITDFPELRDAIERYYYDPRNDCDDIAALCLGILCNCWTREETQNRIYKLHSFPGMQGFRFFRDLGYSLRRKQVEN